nr:hypothetical protein FVER53263_06763 [Fusarium verticillioides]
MDHWTRKSSMRVIQQQLDYPQPPASITTEPVSCIEGSPPFDHPFSRSPLVPTSTSTRTQLNFADRGYNIYITHVLSQGPRPMAPLSRSYYSWVSRRSHIPESPHERYPGSTFHHDTNYPAEFRDLVSIPRLEIIMTGYNINSGVNTISSDRAGRHSVAPYGDDAWIPDYLRVIADFGVL